MDEEERREPQVGTGQLVALLQDALLPKGLPIAQRVELAARYLLAEDHADPGGDWFDAIPLPDGRVVVAVGDVVGPGVEATIVMGELKALFAEEVHRTGDITRALDVLESRARRVPEARTTTLCVCVYDPATGELTYCTAGHPPPALVTAAGAVTYLPSSGGGPLGAGLPFTLARRSLAVGDLVVLYSDGLVQRPGRSPAQNTVELLQAVAAAMRGAGPEADVERVCRQAVELLTGISGYSDDITLLALQAVPATAPLQLDVAAVPDAVRTVRDDLGRWLERLRVSVLDSTAVQHSVGELVANAIEHAYAHVEVENQLSVSACLTVDGIVEIEVADRGVWQVPAQVEDVTGRGRGLAMVRGFVDDFEVAYDALGTRARIRHRISHPAELLRGRSTRDAGTAAEPHLDVDVADTTVTVSGAVDQVGAVRMRRALDRCSRGGVRPIVVDLSAVEVLTSAAVRVLSDARRVAEVELVAPFGSPAQHVLDLVHLPYTS